MVAPKRSEGERPNSFLRAAKIPKLSVDTFQLNHYYALSDDGARKWRAKRNGGWPRRRHLSITPSLHYSTTPSLHSPLPRFGGRGSLNNTAPVLRSPRERRSLRRASNDSILYSITVLSDFCDSGPATPAFSDLCRPFFGKSSQVPFHEPVTHNNPPSRSNPVKPGQTIFMNLDQPHDAITPSLSYSTTLLGICCFAHQNSSRLIPFPVCFCTVAAVCDRRQSPWQ